MSDSAVDYARMNIQELKNALQLHMKYVKRQRGGDRLNLSHKNVESLRFDKIDLSDAELVGLHAANASFKGALLTRANLFGADLTGVDFSNADLTRSDLRGARFARANLEGADLTDSDLREGQIMRQSDEGELSYIDNGNSDSRFDDANLRHSNLEKVRMGRAMGSGTDLFQANLKGARLSGCDFTGADLSGAVLDGADLSDANLARANLKGAEMIGVVLDGACLEGVDLTAARFNKSEIMAAKSIEGAIMPRTAEDLGISVDELMADHKAWMMSGGAKGEQAVFKGVDLTGFAHPGIALSAAEFSDAILTHANFEHSFFSMANFSGAMLAQVNFSHVDLRGAKFQCAKMTKVSLVSADLSAMPIAGGGGRTWPTNLRGANLVDADLTHADLSQCDFTGATLQGADLTSVDVSGANFEGADLTDATVDGVDFSSCVLTDVMGIDASVAKKKHATGTPAAKTAAG